MFIALGIIVLLLSFFGVFIAFSDDIGWLKAASFIGIVLGLIFVVIHFNTAQGARTLKSVVSNTTGGLNRTVEVYDRNGKLIKTYEGKLDVKDDNNGNEILFDLNGKRTIIYNATVIVQEK